MLFDNDAAGGGRASVTVRPALDTLVRRWRATGPGTPAPGVRFVCVHGISGSVENWRPLAGLLTPWAEVVALDLPGFGRHRAPHEPEVGGSAPPGSVDAGVAFVEEVLDHLLVEADDDAPATVLVGNSMGGLIGERVAARRQDVAGLALLNSTLPSAGRRPAASIAVVAGAYLVPGVGRAFQRLRRRFSDPDRTLTQVLALCLAEPGRLPAEVRAEHLDLLRARWGWADQDLLYERAVRSTIAASARRLQLDAELADLDLPVLVLHGARDRLVPVSGARRLARERPHWDVRVADHLGHLPMIEDPPWVAAALRAWWTDVSYPGRARRDPA